MHDVDEDNFDRAFDLIRPGTKPLIRDSCMMLNNCSHPRFCGCRKSPLRRRVAGTSHFTLILSQHLIVAVENHGLLQTFIHCDDSGNA